jgi:amidase
VREKPVNAFDVEGKSITQLQEALASGETTTRDLVEAFVERINTIDRDGPTLRSVLEINPDAEAIAVGLDRERAAGEIRGPLHGIPILLKDNIDTADRMQTTAGSLALLGSSPERDAGVAARLREAGAVLLGKANLSEWANFRSTHSSSGWSARGGQVRNPHGLDRTPGGSSSGSGASVAASLCAASLGTETDGSIVSPATCNGVAGIKPTVGLTSRGGVIPISHSQDSVGPLARSVTDLALVLGAIVGPDDRDPATQSPEVAAGIDYLPALDSRALRGARIGVARGSWFGYSEKADRVIEDAIASMGEAGAEILDPIEIDSLKELHERRCEFEVMLYEAKADINAYLAGRPSSVSIRSLQDIIGFNEEHAAEEMPFFGQELLLMAQKKGPLTDLDYMEALETCRRLARTDGLDWAFETYQLDAMVAPTGGPAHKIDLINGNSHSGGSSSLCAIAGYPIISVPAGAVFGMPVGISFMGKAWNEARLLGLAFAFEQLEPRLQAPRYAVTT